jgi:alkylation response protein AidB-like acyl-CoA dehydrogenase
MERAYDRVVLGTAAQALGVASRCVEMGAAYATQRSQFGRPIGSFQAVKHLLANAHIALEFARPAVYSAADSMARDASTRSRDVSMAKALASDAVTIACKAALQVHGAIGYTEEHDVHLWLRRGFALATAWGDAARHRARVGHAILG